MRVCIKCGETMPSVAETYVNMCHRCYLVEQSKLIAPIDNPTTKEKFTAIVEGMVKALLKDTESVIDIRIRDDLHCKILLEIKDETKRRWSDKAEYKAYSLADLYSNADAMRSIYGEELICNHRPCPLAFPRCSNCVNNVWRPLLAYRHHQQQVIIIDGDDAKIDYLYQHLKERGDEQTRG